MKFVSLLPSTRKDKKYMMVFEDKVIHFGSKVSNTYLDHHDVIKKENYLKRHAPSENWTKINAGSLSRYLLWGDSTDIAVNLKHFLKRFKLE